MTKHIGWIFGLGHGHYTQFLNFRECYPSELEEHAHWMGIRLDTSPLSLSRLPIIPTGVRARLNQAWNVKVGLEQRADWDALFFAAFQLQYWPIFRRYPSWLYLDLTPSLKRQLAPWYDHQLQGLAPFVGLRERLHRTVVQATQGVFTMSRWAAEGVQRDYGLPPDRVHVALPGANLQRWQWIPRRRVPGDAVRILMVGGQFELKGGNLLLTWAKETQLKHWELDIVTWPGELPVWIKDILGRPAPDQQVAASLAPHLPNVRVHCGLKANTSVLMNLFADADIFCLPTQADGSSIASLEAMATGLPVVVGAVGGIPELIDHGITGFLIKPGDRADLASTLERLLLDTDLRQRVGRNARESCEAYFNVDRQMRQIIEVLDPTAPNWLSSRVRTVVSASPLTSH